MPETKPSTLPNRFLPNPGRASGGELGPARRSQVQGIAISPLSAAKRVYQIECPRPVRKLAAAGSARTLPSTGLGEREAAEKIPQRRASIPAAARKKIQAVLGA